MADYEELQKKLSEYGQEHLLDFWTRLSESDRRCLTSELLDLDLRHIVKSFDDCTEDLKQASETLDDQLEPLPKKVLGSVTKSDAETLNRYRTEGLKAISAGKVAVLLLAGGQGTRLGVTYPKGMYDVGLPSHKTLFHLQAQRLLKAQELARSHSDKDCVIPWYIMMSKQTKESTQQYFQKHDYFGLQPQNVVMFEQSTMPCMTFDGKIILETPSSCAKAPDGNGGLYNALRKAKLLDDFHARGIEYLHVYCVDNILVQIADPVFIGFCISKGAACGVKVVEKKLPSEPVGVICKLNGKYHVAEYSEISSKTAEKRDDEGKLVFNAGGIANHFFTVDFMKTIVHSFAVWEVLREDEFSPLKNGNDAATDNPATCRAALMDLHRRWILKSGGKFAQEDNARNSDIPCHKENGKEPPFVCEISPLISYSGEGLEDIVKDKRLISPVVLWHSTEAQQT